MRVLFIFVTLTLFAQQTEFRMPCTLGINSINGIPSSVCYIIPGAIITPASLTTPATMILPVNISPQSGTESGIIVTINRSTGQVGLAVNPVNIPFLDLQNTYSGALNDFSGSQFLLSGARGQSQPPCTLEGTVWYIPGNAITNGQLQVCQNQSGNFSWVNH